MSGHSKWATIKHQKGAKDKARGKLFGKLIRQVEVAAREGGGDPDSNATLRTMIGKARDASVPVDTIDRAVKRGTGELEGVRYEAVTYEGYAPGGVAVLVEALTDNRNRTGAEVRSLFNRLGGSLAEPGAVAWQFDDGDTWRVTSPPAALAAVRSALDADGIAYDSAELTMQPTSTVALGTADDAKKVLRLLDGLDEHDDVQAVHANFDIPDDILTTLSV
jgi:transcriptional/translational regulatory protein YebC/TACO1